MHITVPSVSLVVIDCITWLHHPRLHLHQQAKPLQGHAVSTSCIELAHMSDRIS